MQKEGVMVGRAPGDTECPGLTHFAAVSGKLGEVNRLTEELGTGG